MLTRKVIVFSRILPLQASLRFSSTERNPISVDRLKGDDEGIVLLRMNNPSRRNAIDKRQLDELHKEINLLSRDNSLRVLILKSDVPGAFCSGADLMERKDMPENEVMPHVKRIRRVADKLQYMPIPTIAAIDGVALGGGLEYALACDIRIASTTARMGLIENRLGIFPGAGGARRLPRIVGLAKAKQLLFTGKTLYGREAERIGLVNEVAEGEGRPEAAFQMALEMAREILQSGPIGVRLAKVVMETAMRADANVSDKMEEWCYAQTIPTKDRMEALRAFAEKRKPVFKGE